MRYQVNPKFKLRFLFTAPETGKDGVFGWLVLDQYGNVNFMNDACTHSYVQIDTFDIEPLRLRLNQIEQFLIDGKGGEDA